MNLSTVATIAGYKSHYTQDGQRTLCGREASNATSGIDMCKACQKAADKLTEARERLESATRAAETQDGVMQAAGTTEPTYTPGQPVSVYATVKGETEEFEAAHIPNGVPADVDRWLTWAQDNPNWTNVRAANYTAPAAVDNRTAYERVTNTDNTDGPMSGQFDDYDYAADEVKFAAMDAGTATMCDHGRVVKITDGAEFPCADCEMSPTDATPTLKITTPDKRTAVVSVGEHSMTIRNGSDVRLRAAFWARGLGYRPARGRSVQWHREGTMTVAPLTLV